MNFAIGLIGIIAALVFLTVAVYKGWSILYSSIISVIIIALTNSLNLYEALTVNFVSSFTSYAAAYFILFCEGAMLGKLYDASGAAWKIGKTVVDKCGTKFAIVGYMAVAAILEYGLWQNQFLNRQRHHGICGRLLRLFRLSDRS